MVLMEHITLKWVSFTNDKLVFSRALVICVQSDGAVYPKPQMLEVR